MKSIQETFDAVVAHFVTMKEPSISETGDCKYRGVDGGKCFAGALIPDDLYSPDMENQVATHYIVATAFREHDAHFVRTLQMVHDSAAMGGQRNGEWFAEAKARLLTIAKDRGLTAPLLEAGKATATSKAK